MLTLIMLHFHTVIRITNYHQERCILQQKGKIVKFISRHYIVQKDVSLNIRLGKMKIIMIIYPDKWNPLLKRVH